MSQDDASDAIFVDLETSVPNVHLDIRYATTNNFMGRVMYATARAFLVPEAADALREASEAFGRMGVGVVVWDAYRPFTVTRQFWDETVEADRIFVANPAGGSVHNRGCAIDMTLRDLSTGTYFAMPTDFDEFSPRSFVSYEPDRDDVRENRGLLITTMAAHNFNVIPREWWHFNLSNYQRYAILDVPFDEISI